MRANVVGTALIATALASSQAAAQSACDKDATELRAHLSIAVRNVDRWNLAWRITFGTATVVQLGLALAHQKPLGTFDQDYQETLYVGVAKAAIATAGRFVTPLRATLPEPLSDRCADVVVVRAAIEDLARRERQLFYFTHVGAVVLNLVGAIVLGERRSWSAGATSFALGYPVGLLSIYTMPRASWKLVREPGWSVIVRRNNGWSLEIAGAF